MTRQKNKFSKITDQENSNLFDESSDKNTFQTLKQAWKELPPDFTMGERSLFIEIAERLIKAAGDSDRKIN